MRAGDLIAAAGLGPSRTTTVNAAAARAARCRLTQAQDFAVKVGASGWPLSVSKPSPGELPMTSTTTAFLAVSQNLSRYQTMTAAEPAVKTATAYYEANIGSVKSINDLVGNYRLLSYALNAYGLGDQINAKGLITKVLEGGVSNPKSLANTLPDSRWKAFAAAFNFRRQRRNSPFIDQRGGDDNERLCRTAAGERSGRPRRGRPTRALFPARRADGQQRIWNFGRSQSSESGCNDHGALAGGRKHVATEDALRAHAASPTCRTRQSSTS